MHPSHRQVSKEKKKEKTTTHRHIRHQRIPLSITHTRECQPHKRHSTNKQSNTNSHTHAATRHQACKPHHHHNSETLSHSPSANHNPPSHIIVKTHNPSHTHRTTDTRTRMRPSHRQVSREEKKNHNTQTQAHPSPAHPTIYHTHT